MSLKSGRPSHPRYLNLRGGLPTWTPPTFADVALLVDAARARGFEASLTADCKAIVHGVCQPYMDRRTRATLCRRSDIQLRAVETLDHLTPEPCAEHAAVVA